MPLVSVDGDGGRLELRWASGKQGKGENNTNHLPLNPLT